MRGIPVGKITLRYISVEVMQDGVASKKLQDIKLADLGLPVFQYPDICMEHGELHPVPYSIVCSK